MAIAYNSAYIQTETLNFTFAQQAVITCTKEGGYVFGLICLSVCLSIRRITRKLVNGF